MTDVKLLTEAEWIALLHESGCVIAAPVVLTKIGERGLIAPEPVDALALEVDALFDAWDKNSTNDLVLAALRRGLELAPTATPLTRGMLEEALTTVWPNWALLNGERTVTRLHAALTEQSK